uniref:Uncharacterized protein n=1 Tax=Utricularia reniformis TaxID=192314 RepID=A0A1Y0AZS0_9LAMI|nr:hypothetical protein AEK19_MT0361 [Utricularia reniformis]ART30633.1 hypothetical protein AEK19_MT0361 [Utricularia reniformis]
MEEFENLVFILYLNYSKPQTTTIRPRVDREGSNQTYETNTTLGPCSKREGRAYPP